MTAPTVAQLLIIVARAGKGPLTPAEQRALRDGIRRLAEEARR